MEKKSSKKLTIGLGLIAVLVVVCLVLNMLLAQYKDMISFALAGESGGYGDYSAEEIHDMGKDINIRQEEEGAVLLKNKDNNALPLTNEKVTILGYYSYAYVMGNNSGASAGNAPEDLPMLDAFKNAGISVNETAWQTLRTATAKASHVGSQITAGNSKELSVDKYEEKFTSSVLGAYTDAAIVTISRLGGEGASIAVSDLRPSENELALLNWAKGKFGKVIVLVNSSNVMELGEVVEIADAVLWIGTTGAFGMQGVANILAGKVSPSGRTVDTWAYDMTTAPALYNVNDNKYSNYNTYGYYQYEEGIYVCYRWYETANAEGYWNSEEFGGYENVVQYPFGYGLSYTTFTQEIKESDINLEAGGTNSITVTVKNTGTVAGQEVVQVYLRAPYNTDETCGINDNGTRVPLEKADKVLVGFAKTGELAAGTGTEDVTITFETDDLASYDVFGHNCYVLEKGEYEFVLGQNAHIELDSVKETLADTIVYNEEGAGARSGDKVVATNKLDDVTAGDGWAMSLADAYLSRSDFAKGIEQIQKYGNAAALGTTVADEDKEAVKTEILAILQLSGGQSADYTYNVYRDSVLTTETSKYYLQGALDEAYATTNYWGESTSDNKYNVTFGDSSKLNALGITLEDMEGADYDDERWEAILDAVTLEEAISWHCDQQKTTPAINSLGLGEKSVKDGACQVGADTGLTESTWFASAVVTASTWNIELAKELGEVFGNQSVYYNTLGLYAPSMNIHRTPLGGRNIEYYSEDGFISGSIGAAQVEGIQSTGTMVYLKHCLLNDNDTNRSGAITWLSEQAFREIYARPYEISIKEGGALGIMGALNRVGMTWAHPGFYLSILRDEWGFDGFVITDMATAGGTCMSTNVALCSGIAMMKGSSVISNSANDVVSKTSDLSAYSKYMLREVLHHGLYQFVNANLFSTPALEPNTTWIVAWIIVDVLIVAGIVLLYIFMVHKPLVAKIKTAMANKNVAKSETPAEGTVNTKPQHDDDDDDD